MNIFPKLIITTSDKEDKAIFYTALYHTGISPNLFTDADGRYLGMDLEVHQGDTLNPIYTVFSLLGILSDAATSANDYH